MMRSALAAAVLLALWLAEAGHAQPSLTTTQPGAVAPGQAVEVTLHGAKLADPLSVWTSFGAAVEVLPEVGADGQPAPVKPDRAAVRCRITAPAEAVVGVGAIVVATPEGASDSLLIMVDDLASVADNAANHTIEAAQEIAPPIAVDGVGDGAVFDYYKFTAKAGQRLAFEVVAARLGSPFDPLLRLLDETGNELRFADDDPGLGVDCRFAHVFEQDGVYLLEVGDVRYRGGATHRYRLRIGDFPLLTTPYPLGAKGGESASLAFTGPDGAGTPQVNVSLAEPSLAGARQIAARLPGGAASATSLLAVDDLPEEVEAEPNNEPSQASELAVPAAVSGRFESEGDVDYFRIAAKKDQPLVVRATTAPLGSPSRVMLRVCNLEGGTISQAGGSGEGVETIAFTPPADGDYLIAAEELLRRHGPEHAYRIDIRPQRPTFSLALKSDNTGKRSFLADAGGAIAVDLVSSGHASPITLSVEGLAGATVRNNPIPAGAKEFKALIDLPAGATPGQLATLRLVGKADDQIQLVRAAPLIKARNAALSRIPPALEGELFVATGAAAAAPYAAQPDRPAVVLPRGAARAALSLKIERKDANFKAPLQVFVDGLPSGLAAEVKQTGKDAEEAYEVAVVASGEIAEGDHAAAVAIYGEHGGRVIKTSLPLPVKVVTPVSVAFSAAGPLPQGGKQKVKLSVRRFLGEGADPGAAVKLQFTHLPAGVTGPGEIALTAVGAEQLDLEVELSASADAPVAKAENVQVEAVTMFAGAEARAASPAGVVEVVAKP